MVNVMDMTQENLEEMRLNASRCNDLNGQRRAERQINSERVVNRADSTWRTSASNP